MDGGSRGTHEFRVYRVEGLGLAFRMPEARASKRGSANEIPQNAVSLCFVAL